MSALASPPRLSLSPLLRLVDQHGIVEHACGRSPAHAHGYCTDDAARALLLASRLGDQSEARDVADVCLSFLTRAHRGDGLFTLRLFPHGGARGPTHSDDACGRAIQGLAEAATFAPWPSLRAEARSLFAQCGAFRSPYPRAMAHAAVGACRMLEFFPRDAAASQLLDAARAVLPRPVPNPMWPWPEPRLTYGNALLPEALMAVGQQCGDQHIVDDGLAMLRWLRKQETSPLGHLSFTPVGGWTRGEPRPGFDQQPIEAWHYAEAGLRAYAHTGDEVWKELVGQCVDWFDTRNDSGLRMWDETTGAAFDGLERHKPNLNQGAESTLALLGTLWSVQQTAAITQQLRRQQPPIRSAGLPVAPDQVCPIASSTARADVVAPPTQQSAAP